MTGVHRVIDGHNDLPWAARELADHDLDRLDLTDSDLCRVLGTHTDLPRLREGGVGAQFWSVFVPCTLTGGAAVTATLEQVDFVHRMVEKHSDDLVLATGVADVERAWETGRIASLMGAEGGHQIDESLATLRMYHRLGVRYLTLTHNDNVSWADSATDEPVLGGLSDFGVEVVREMNRIGMLVDLSHVSTDVMRRAIEVSIVPVVFSHSSARAVTDHPRNVPDDVLQSLRTNGGVCMVTFVPYFVNARCRDWMAEARAAVAEQGIEPTSPEEKAFLRDYREKHPAPNAGIDDVVAHVEHVREVAGIEHVGLGGDYDGVDVLPDGLEDVGGYPRLLAALAGRGWTDDDLRRLTHANVLRVMGDAGLTSTQQDVVPA